MKLGSLFDGSGTAPLAAAMCGIEPVWASEIEKYPMAVTKARFPEMQHLGDITKIDGHQIAWVDIICGGSPCQDLSVAGKQKGLHSGERSHLFFEMTRIIREMREASNGKYPKYIVWENVPGAFSSNDGRDFLAVLQAFAEIADPAVYVPEPTRKGKTDRLDWENAGCIVGDGWSIAWRIVDAQYWGVPQRRRRIYLVVDLGGECAEEILFERKGMRGHSEACGTSWKGTSADVESGFRAGDRDEEAGCLTPWDYQSKRVFKSDGIFPTLQSGERPTTAYTTDVGFFASLENLSPPLLARMYKDPHLVTYDSSEGYCIVRRLTPLECCRLQGFPDWWMDGVEGSDSAKYKMWGNGMALPNMLHVMRGIRRAESACSS